MLPGRRRRPLGERGGVGPPIRASAGSARTPPRRRGGTAPSPLRRLRRRSRPAACGRGARARRLPHSARRER
ncbi:MAG: hypothetical protein D6729_09705 [Deltaproteobacteria bacterium]|nr:MAG: hypothetical protein D6729_09705 [Deltaproteobacteria bacterium]